MAFVRLYNRLIYKIILRRYFLFSSIDKLIWLCNYTLFLIKYKLIWYDIVLFSSFIYLT